MLLEAQYTPAIGALSENLDLLKDTDIKPGVVFDQIPIGRTRLGYNFSAIDPVVGRLATCLAGRIDPNDPSLPLDRGWMKHPPSKRLHDAMRGMGTAQPGDYMTVIIRRPADPFLPRNPQTRMFPSEPDENIVIRFNITTALSKRLAGQFVQLDCGLYTSTYPDGPTSRHNTPTIHILMASVFSREAGNAYGELVARSGTIYHLATRDALLHPYSGGLPGQGQRN